MVKVTASHKENVSVPPEAESDQLIYNHMEQEATVTQAGQPIKRQRSVGQLTHCVLPTAQEAPTSHSLKVRGRSLSLN